MCKAEKNLSKLIFPSDDSSEEVSDIKQCLQEIHFPEVDLEWLIQVFKRPDCYGDPNGTSAFNEAFSADFQLIIPSAVEKLRYPIQTGKDRQTRLAFLFQSLLGFGGLGEAWLPKVGIVQSGDSLDIPEWIGKFQEHAQFCVQNLDWWQLKELPRFENLLPFLLPEGVPLDQIIDLDLLDPIPSNNEFNDPAMLEFWLIWRFRANAERCDMVSLGDLLRDFSGFSDDILGDKILGLLNAIYNAMTIASGRLRAEERLDPQNDGWRVVARELIPFLRLLTERRVELNQGRASSLKAWWRLSQLIYSWSNGGLESELSDELRNRLVESASRHVGILRSVLRDTPEIFAAEDSPEVPVSDFYDKAFYVLLVFAQPWKRLKPLLLAFIEMTEQAVARDLRTWREHDSKDNPPPTYSRVANWIEVAMYSQNLRAELQKDPDLQNLREEFAKFCLSRLRTKTKGKDSDYTDEDFVEPRRVWRGCYVQALAALRVNPGGRAHRTLFWLLNNDPDEEIREYARRAHKQVRHLDRKKSNLDEGASPRRPLFEAFWWLRQAHLMTLGIEIDRPGAMRTRRRELHRTREKDDRYNRKK